MEWQIEWRSPTRPGLPSVRNGWPRKKAPGGKWTTRGKKGWETTPSRRILTQASAQNFQVSPAVAVIRHAPDCPPETFVVGELIAFRPWRSQGANDKS